MLYIVTLACAYKLHPSDLECSHEVDAKLQEWGNPVANKSTYDLMLSYSPMDNIIEQQYPSMLAIGGIPLSLCASRQDTLVVVKRRQDVQGHCLAPLPLRLQAMHRPKQPR